MGMSDLKKYIAARKKTDKEFSAGFDEGYEQFKIGYVLRRARESAGLTQEELALRLNTTTAHRLSYFSFFFRCEM